MPGHLRVGGAVVGLRWRDRLRLAEIVDLHHPRDDGPARRLPDQRGSEAGGEDQAAEGHEPPVSGLDTR